MTTEDPRFRHHPQLVGRITEPLESNLRDMSSDWVRENCRKLGVDTDWILPDVEREACRARTLDGRWASDLWIFGYGSLMWNPGVLFEEVRRAYLPGLERRFILRDVNGGRGTPDRPGLIAALDDGGGCNGLAFRIAAANVGDESRRLWARERIGHAYRPEFRTAETDHGEIEVLAFVADHDARHIIPDLSHDEQVRCGATGAGVLGTSREYLESLAAQFEALRIEDPGLTRLVEDVRAYADRLTS